MEIRSQGICFGVTEWWHRAFYILPGAKYGFIILPGFSSDFSYDLESAPKVPKMPFFYVFYAFCIRNASFFPKLTIYRIIKLGKKIFRQRSIHNRSSNHRRRRTTPKKKISCQKTVKTAGKTKKNL